MIKYVLAVIMLLVSAESPVAQEASLNIARLMEGLPKQTLRKIREKPEVFIEEAAGLIFGFGTGAEIGPDGIKQFITLERARMRANAMRKMLRADLDNDGAVGVAEMQVLMASETAKARGRMMLAHSKADLNGDQDVDPSEMRSFAQTQAMQALSQADEAVLLGFMTFDLDGSGTVDLAEVSRVVQALQESA